MSSGEAGAEVGSPDRQLRGSGGCTERWATLLTLIELYMCSLNVSQLSWAVDQTTYTPCQQRTPSQTRLPPPPLRQYCATTTLSGGCAARPDWPASDCVDAVSTWDDYPGRLGQGHTGRLTLCVLGPASLLRCRGNGKTTGWRLAVKKMLWEMRVGTQAVLLHTQWMKRVHCSRRCCILQLCAVKLLYTVLLSLDLVNLLICPQNVSPV